MRSGQIRRIQSIIYYVNIKKCVEDSILSYTYIEYMNSMEAKQEYIQLFNQNLYDPDLHYIVETGQADFNARGFLAPITKKKYLYA